MTCSSSYLILRGNIRPDSLDLYRAYALAFFHGLKRKRSLDIVTRVAKVGRTFRAVSVGLDFGRHACCHMNPRESLMSPPANGSFDQDNEAVGRNRGQGDA